MLEQIKLSSYPSIDALLAEPGGIGTATFSPEITDSVHPQAQALLRYCDGLRSRTGVLERAMIRPRDIITLLPHLFIAEPHGEDWRFRLCGTGLAKRLTIDLTGRTLGTLYEPDMAVTVRRLYDFVVRRQTVEVRAGRFFGLGIEHAECDVVHMALQTADPDIRHVFGGVFFR